jgi:UDP-2-acetamido-2-deoxy-ribo-hexuluronate aminotransferase
LAAKLRRLDEWLGQRRQLARQYREALESERLIDESGGGLNSDIHLVAAGRADDQRHAFNLFVIRTARRDALRSHLARQGVATGVYYTRPLHLQPCFDKLGYRPGDFPFAEQAAAEVLALPFYPGLPADHIRRVVRAIASFFKE